MMKKQGFTLAEVLITLTIIGVIATMTLPALMTNTQEQQAKTGLKKGINTLTEAAQMHEAIEGFNYASLSDNSVVAKINETSWTEGEGDKEEEKSGNSVKSLAGMLRERTKIDIGKTMDAAEEGASTITVGAGTDASPAGTNPQVIYFADGSALIFDDSKVTSQTTDVGSDGLATGFTVVYDTNGLKGPNQLSNCSAKRTGGLDADVKTDEGEVETEASNIKLCEKKDQRVIKDQFTLKLRGNVVEPEGAAATWAFGI